MKLVQKRSHRGIIGIESAIVMIAFVIVAAALAFVVLNTGFSTTQKAKTTIISSLGEASSALEVSGKITGVSQISASALNVTSIPIKVASGGDSVNLGNSSISIKYVSNDVEYDNILSGPIFGTQKDLTTAFDAATTQGLSAYSASNSNPVTEAGPNQTSAIIYWTVNANNNTIIDQGEHAVLAIAWSDAERPQALDKMKAEILTAKGSTLTVEREIPNLSTLITDLG